MRYEVRVAGRALAVDIDHSGRFVVDGEVVPAEIQETVHGLQWVVRVDGRTHEVTALTPAPLRLSVEGVHLDASVEDERMLQEALHAACWPSHCLTGRRTR